KRNKKRKPIEELVEFGFEEVDYFSKYETAHGERSSQSVFDVSIK
ncbi:17799_t:CDS:2, partial [Gigaspora margarita]